MPSPSNPKSKFRTEANPEHIVLRETLRHYLEYRDIVMSPSGSRPDGKAASSILVEDGVIDYGYFIYDDEGNIKDKIEISLSFWDLQDCLKPQSEGGILSDRKREAIFYNVILDWRQQDAADKMNITTVSVGQYVEQGCMQLAQKLFHDKEK